MIQKDDSGTEVQGQRIEYISVLVYACFVCSRYNLPLTTLCSLSFGKLVAILGHYLGRLSGNPTLSPLLSLVPARMKVDTHTE